jgi:hypothetical protein
LQEPCRAGVCLLFYSLSFLHRRLEIVLPTPNRGHLVQVARRIKHELGDDPFVTMERLAVTDMVRTVSGEEGTRIKTAMAVDLEQALLEQGVRCFPSLHSTTSGDIVRFFHTATTMGALVDLLMYPDCGEDPILRGTLTKVRTLWKSTPMSGP